METIVLKMKIIKKTDRGWEINISNNKGYTHLLFNPKDKKIFFIHNNDLAEVLKQNYSQIKKMLVNKRKGTFYPGFELNFVLRNRKDVKAFDDKTKIIVLDKRNGNYKCYAVERDRAKNNIHKVYTDASFLEKLNKGAYCILIKDLKGEYSLYRQKSSKINSALLELVAAIKGVEILKDIECIRLVTDSWYVRKGLTEWVVNWKLNNWYTVKWRKG